MNPQDDPKPARILRCVACHKWTSTLEAGLRLFNTGRCGYCNGELQPVKWYDDEKESAD